MPGWEEDELREGGGLNNKNWRVEYDATKKTRGEMNKKKDLVEEDARKRRRWCDGGGGIEWRKMPAREEDDVTEEGG